MPSFIDDDTDWILIANFISFDRSNLSLLPFGSGHGPMTAYLIKISGLLFGNNAFGWRLSSVICGSLLILVIYFLTKIGLGEKQAILAAFLSSINILFIFFSKYSSDDIFSVFFFTLTLLCFFLALSRESNFYAILTGVAAGFSFLTKETTVLLLLVFLIFIVNRKKYWFWLAKKETYISFGIALLISSPYIVWLITHKLYFFLPEVEEGGQWFGFLNFPSAVLYLFTGYPSSLFNRDLALGYHYVGPVMGFLCMIGGIFSLKHIRNDFIRLLSVVFWAFVLSEVLFIKGIPRQFMIIIVPGIILASAFLVRIYGKNILTRCVVIFLLTCSCVYSFAFTLKLNNDYFPMHSQIRITFQNQKTIKVDLNDLAKAVIKISKPYNPSLIILPDSHLDPLDNFVNAHSLLKTLGTSPENRYLPYQAKDLRRILVLTDSDMNLEKYLQWGRKNNYKISHDVKKISLEKKDFPSMKLAMLIGDHDHATTSIAIENLINLSMP